MKKFLAVLTIAALAASTPADAAVHECAVPVVASGGAAGVGLFLGAVGAAAGATYLIGTNQDPVWHPLACFLFGDDGRVGTEKISACAYHDK